MSSEATDSRQIYKRVGIISFFTLLSRILGAVRDLALTHVFGAGIVHDAYVVAQTIPNALRRLTAEGSMTLALVPVYTDVREQQGQEQARLFARKALGLVLFATVLLTVLGIIFSREIVLLFASGFSDDPRKFDLTVLLTQFMFPYLIFISVVAWAMGILNAEKRFAAPAAAPIFLNVGIITGALWFTGWTEPPVLGVAIGMLVGGVIQVLLQWPSLRKVSQPLLPRGFLKDDSIHQLLRLLAPSLFGVAVYEINIIVLRTIASTFPDGQMTYYYISSRLTELVVGLFAFAFAAASFPELSKQSSHKQWAQVFDTLRFAFSGAMFIILPAAVGLIFIAEPIVKMLYLHGEFTVRDADITVNVLQAFAISIPALTMTRILLPAFYSLKDAKTPVVVAGMTVLVTGGAGYGLGQYYEVVGLGFGLSVGSWFQALMLYTLLRRKGHFERHVLPVVDMLKYLSLAVVAVGAAYGVSTRGEWNAGPTSAANWLVLPGAMVTAACIYFLFMLMIKDPHAKRLVAMVRSRLGR